VTRFLVLYKYSFCIYVCIVCFYFLVIHLTIDGRQLRGKFIRSTTDSTQHGDLPRTENDGGNSWKWLRSSLGLTRDDDDDSTTKIAQCEPSEISQWGCHYNNIIVCIIIIIIIIFQPKSMYNTTYQ